MKPKIPVGKIDHDEETENPVAPNEQKGNRLLMMIIAKACGGCILICQSQITTNVRTEDLKIWQFFVLIVVVFCRQALLRLLTAPPPPQLTLTVGTHGPLVLVTTNTATNTKFNTTNTKTNTDNTSTLLLKYPSLALPRPTWQLDQLFTAVTVR